MIIEAPTVGAKYGPCNLGSLPLASWVELGVRRMGPCCVCEMCGPHIRIPD